MNIISAIFLRLHAGLR